ncbi:MAG: carbohydrate-binding family 9-like protein [Niameybacter sp.]|uniref:carbohydrate-binding family 9-like protein n=1 Tax=Niameybacter sp. TaxID=2033640 RepID=UPI002FCC2C1E
MTYIVEVKAEKVEWNSIKPVEVASYPWGTDYMPKTTARLYRIEGQGFCLKMRCEEENPKALYTEANEPVYKDSCMEFFANYYPEEAGTGYINFEMNSKGAVLCEYGQPGDRFYLKDKGFDIPTPVVTKEGGCWEVELMIPDTFIQAVYGKEEMGGMIKGNFYKCGDDTHTPHYGSWNPIDNPFPAFHKPEYFGELVIK